MDRIAGLLNANNINKKGSGHPFILEELPNYPEPKTNFAIKYEQTLNICFSQQPQLIKFDSNSTDEEIDNFFDSL